jgi:hypothetical protein
LPKIQCDTIIKTVSFSMIRLYNIRILPGGLSLMKRGLLAVFCALILASQGFAQISLSGLSPKDPRSMGMGGAFRVFAKGYSAFFGNPVGFIGPNSFTFGDVSTWLYMKPYPREILDLLTIYQGEATEDEYRNTLGALIAGNGFGGGGSLGFGWSGGGFGLGMTFITDTIITGTTYDDASMEIKNQLDGIIGVAWPLDVGPFTITFGVDMRAFYRLDSRGSWPFGSLTSALFKDDGFKELISLQNARGGYGLALDSGATLSFGPLTAGVMIRDYGYKFLMSDTTVGEILDKKAPPFTGSILYALTPTYVAGLSLVLQNTNALIASFHAEVENPIGFVEAAKTDFESSLNLIHVGMELEILKFLSLRAGFNKGLFSLGFGLDFALLEVDAAIFTEPAAGFPAGYGRTGVALQSALRF